MAKHTIPMKVQASILKFESARSNLENFRKDHPTLIEEHDMLREAYNSTLAEAKAVYKDNHKVVGPSCGEFSVRKKRLINAEALVEFMGDEADAYVKKSYSVNRKEYTKAIKEGRIPQKIVKAVESQGTPSIYGPTSI